MLSAKEQGFADAYLKSNWNLAKAVQSVGYTPHAGRMLLARPAVKDYIEQHLLEASLSVQKVVARLSEMATSSVGDFLNEDGKVKLTEVRERGYLVKRYKVRNIPQEDGPDIVETELELYDALNALTTIAKTLGLFTDIKMHIQNSTTQVINQRFDFTKVGEEELLRIQRTLNEAKIEETAA